MTLYSTLTILATHCLFDFALQTHSMASNKSKCLCALSSHVGVYTIGLLIVGTMNLFYFQAPFLKDNTLGSIVAMLLWVILNSALHFATDYVTSKATSALWEEKRVHDFFTVVGLDQLFHYCCLFLTFEMLSK